MPRGVDNLENWYINPGSADDEPAKRRRKNCRKYQLLTTNKRLNTMRLRLTFPPPFKVQVVPKTNNTFYLYKLLGCTNAFDTKTECDAEVERIYKMIESRIVKFGKL